jgi:hypothetical protein
MDEENQDYYTSFKDGDPRETLFDDFNAHFETDN